MTDNHAATATKKNAALFNCETAPKVSIIMPAYNAQKTIGESINSVLAQTFRNWELIIIDDASCDGTTLQIPADPRITILTNETNAGVSVSRNRGISCANGKWLAFLDADDLWKSDKLEKQLKFIEETKACISYTATAYMDAEGEISGYILRAKKELTRKDLLRANLMSCSGVMVRRDVMRPFPSERQMGKKKTAIHEDYALWLSIVDVAYGLDEPLLIYRMSQISKSGGRLSSAKMIYNAYRYAKYNKIQAAALTLRYAVHSFKKRICIRIKKYQRLRD